MRFANNGGKGREVRINENNDHQGTATTMRDEVDVRSQASKGEAFGQRNPWLPLRGSLRTFMAESFSSQYPINFSAYGCAATVRGASLGACFLILAGIADQMSIQEEQLRPIPQACFLGHR